MKGKKSRYRLGGGGIKDWNQWTQVVWSFLTVSSMLFLTSCETEPGEWVGWHGVILRPYLGHLHASNSCALQKYYSDSNASLYLELMEFYHKTLSTFNMRGLLRIAKSSNNER